MERKIFRVALHISEMPNTDMALLIKLEKPSYSLVLQIYRDISETVISDSSMTMANEE